MNLNDYFDPVSLDKPEHHILDNPNAFCRNITTHTPSQPISNLSQHQVALFGVPEGRNTLNTGCFQGPDKIRNKLYQLIKINAKTRIYDLGNLKTGGSVEDTLFGIRDAVRELLEHDMVCIIMGGPQYLTLPACQAWGDMKKKYNLCTVDSHLDFDVKPSKDPVSSTNYLNGILHGKSYLFSYSNLAQQQYFVEHDHLSFLEDHLHYSLRLGQMRSSIKETEPVLRDSHILSLDMRSVRFSDAPGFYNPSPNGLYGEEISQIARYAGLSQNLRIFGLFETNPAFDPQDISAHLASQLIWYFLEGLGQRSLEMPSSENPGFKKFIIRNEQVHDLVFYKSLTTERWWMEVPVIHGKSGTSLIASCSEEDYKTASSQNIPDRWWKLFQKMN